MEFSDEVAGRLLMQVVSTIFEFHHPRARAAALAVAQAAREFGEAATRPAWQPLLTSYGALARALNEHMHEEEETILDRIQTLFGQGKLLAGAMRHSQGSFEDLQLEHDDQRSLLRRVEEELEKTASLEAEGPKAANLRAAIEAFVGALRAHVAFEDDALVPAAERFLGAHVT